MRSGYGRRGNETVTASSTIRVLISIGVDDRWKMRFDRARAAEARYNAIIERTEQLQAPCQGLEREPEKTIQVVSSLRYAWEREERALESKKREQENQEPSREFWWWLGAVLLVGFIGVLAGDLAHEAAMRILILLF